MEGRSQVPLDTFVIHNEVTGENFKANFGDGPALVVEGYGGWKVVNRPREVGIVEWEGRSPMLIEIPFLLDYIMEEIDEDPGEKCEEQVHRLERLCGLGGHSRPPICTIQGRGLIPHDETNAPETHKWVVENVSWDANMETRSIGGTGNRLQCGGKISLRQYLTAENILKRLSSKSRAVTPKTYVVVAGDTLAKIAGWMYKDSTKWKRIADANPKLTNNPRHKLKAGKRLKIPQS